MDAETIHKLNRLTTDFYAHCAPSFSATRSQPWNGWKMPLDVLASKQLASPLKVLDLGCGNLRFEKFIADELNSRFEFWGVDYCPQLLPELAKLCFQELDIISELANDTLVRNLTAPDCDLVCAFGLFHHVPSAELRERLLDAMIEKTKPGGIVALSLWRFEADERLFEKAKEVTVRALAEHPSLQLEEHDWLLDWQRREGFFRYCHSFSDGDIDALVTRAARNATLLERFRADGKEDELNEYLVFEKIDPKRSA